MKAQGHTASSWQQVDWERNLTPCSGHVWLAFLKEPLHSNPRSQRQATALWGSFNCEGHIRKKGMYLWEHSNSSLWGLPLTVASCCPHWLSCGGLSYRPFCGHNLEAAMGGLRKSLKASPILRPGVSSWSLWPFLALFCRFGSKRDFMGCIVFPQEDVLEF